MPLANPRVGQFSCLPSASCNNNVAECISSIQDGGGGRGKDRANGKKKEKIPVRKTVINQR